MQGEVDRRVVILLCGPPGSGKTTLARTLDLTVYDIDDQQWRGSEKRFREALRRLGQTPGAQAVVIRSGATRSARQAAAEMVGATDVRVLPVDAGTCARRVTARNRARPPLRAQLAAVRLWWDTYEPDEQVTTSREW